MKVYGDRARPNGGGRWVAYVGTAKEIRQKAKEEKAACMMQTAHRKYA